MLITLVVGLGWSKALFLLCRDSFHRRQHQMLALDQEWQKYGFCTHTTQPAFCMDRHN